jgi:tetratricopeptide (TPR) repeat protein
LVLAEPLLGRFNSVRLVQPFEESLARKRELMDETLGSFERLATYGVGDITAAATYSMAEVYYDFSRALLESERPTGLDSAGLVEYEEVLEEEAFPFEELAIEVHEKNLELIASGTYNDWIDKSLAKLAGLVPGRYAKEEIRSDLLESLESFAYRLPAAGEPAAEDAGAVVEAHDRKRGRSARSGASLEVIAGTGFTINDHTRVDADVRANFDSAIAELQRGRDAAGIALLVGVTEQAPELAHAHIDLGIAYARTGDLDHAAQRFEAALALNPDHPIAYNELGLIYRRQGRFALARETYERGLAVYPALHLTTLNLAILCDLYLRDGNCALRNYEAYRQAVPDDERAGMWMDDLRRRIIS